MSIDWAFEDKGVQIGSDGDHLHGHVVINYWEPRSKVKAEVDRVLEVLRGQLLALDANFRAER